MNKKISALELKKNLCLHAKFLETNEKEGSRADLSGANLINADLIGANLREATLSGANLMGAKLKYGILTQPVITMTLSYWVFVTEFHVQVGCQQFLHDDFLALTESDAERLDAEQAVEFYKTYRPLIVAAIESSKK